MNVKLDAIRIDGGTQPRAAICEETVRNYAYAMTEGATFPPVVVFFDGVAYWLADGFHRYHASRRGGFLEIPAEVREGTRRDAVLYSVGANQTNGLQRSSLDKRRAVSILLADPEWATWNDSRIARHCGVDGKTVAVLRPPVSSEIPKMETQQRKVERGGTVYTMNVSNIGPRTEPVGPEASAAVAVMEPPPSAPEVSERTRQVNQAAYERVTAFLFGSLEGSRLAIVDLLNDRTAAGRAMTSAVARALTVAHENGEDVSEWAESLTEVVAAVKRLQTTLREGART